MNILTKVLTLSALALGTVLPSQAQNMKISLRNGETHAFPTADIEQVSFDGKVIEQGPFDITISEITSVSAKIDVVPENKSIPYYFDVCYVKDYERYGVKAIVENYFNSMSAYYPDLSMDILLEAIVSRGADSDVVQGLPSDAEMVCYAIGVDSNGKCVGEPSVVPFKTLPGGNPEDCTFDISYTDLDDSSLTIHILPSDPTVKYWMGCYSAFDWPGDEAMASAVKSTIEEASKSYGMSVQDVVQSVTFRGPASVDESGFDANRTYYIYVYAMDEDGNAAGQMFKKDFTTQEIKWSDAKLSLSYRYFDGDEMAEMYPDKFSKAKGGVVVQPVFTPDELTVNYVWAVAAGDYTDISSYPDDATRASVLQQGYVNIPSKNIYARWGKCTFLYYASDAWGVDGYLSRMLVDLTPEGASPASTYYDVENGTTTGAPMKINRVRASQQGTNKWKRFSTLRQVPSTMRQHTF